MSPNKLPLSVLGCKFKVPYTAGCDDLMAGFQSWLLANGIQWTVGDQRPKYFNYRHFYISPAGYMTYLTASEYEGYSAKELGFGRLINDIQAVSGELLEDYTKKYEVEAKNPQPKESRPVVDFEEKQLKLEVEESPTEAKTAEQDKPAPIQASKENDLRDALLAKMKAQNVMYVTVNDAVTAMEEIMGQRVRIVSNNYFDEQ